MKKIKIITFACLFLVSLFLITSIGCKKQSIEKLKGKGMNEIMTTPLAITIQEITDQMRWIARGYPGVINGIGVLSELKSNLITKDNYEDLHMNLNPEVFSSISVDLESDVYSKNLINFGSPNSYLREYFYDFEYDLCVYKTGLRIIDTIDNSLPWVVTYDSEDLQNSRWGYFINSGTGDLDSLTLDTSNYENYMVFVVYNTPTCTEAYATTHPNDGCNENGVCEKNRGETAANCSDCSNSISGFPEPLNGEHVLKVVWAKINEDVRTFDEAWIESKYEVCWDYWIGAGTSGLIHLQRTGDLGISKLFHKWKRKEVPIQRKNKLRHTPTEHDCSSGDDMYQKFIPASHDIYIRFWDDEKKNGWSNTVDCKTTANNTIIFPGTKFLGLSSLGSKGGSFYHGGSSSAGDGVLVIPANSTWTAETVNGVNQHYFIGTTPSGEITVKLVTID